MGSKIGRGVGRSRKAGIPDELWADSIEIARREGTNRNAQELHLDGGQLKCLMAATDSVASEVLRQPRFAELITPACAQPDEYVRVRAESMARSA